MSTDPPLLASDRTEFITIHTNEHLIRTEMLRQDLSELSLVLVPHRFSLIKGIGFKTVTLRTMESETNQWGSPEPYWLWSRRGQVDDSRPEPSAVAPQATAAGMREPRRSRRQTMREDCFIQRKLTRKGDAIVF